jgi:regulatory protein
MPLNRPLRSTRRKAASSGDPRLAAVSLLARRDFAAAELRERLLEKGFAAEEVDDCVQEMVASKALDDARYAEHYVAYHAARGEGPLRIRMQLSRLGVAGALIETALTSGPDWRALARQVRSGKFGAEAPASWPQKARQARFLQYRGFSADHIRAATGADPDLD